MNCALCRIETAPDALDRISGIQVCSVCRSIDPTNALKEQGISAEWDTRLQRFSAGLSIPGLPGDFFLRCAPELWHHQVVKMVVHEVQVGDPLFDRRVYIRTSDPDLAADMLSNEGVQSALLALLSGLRTNELLANQVAIHGNTVTISVKPEAGLSEERVLDLKLETAALAIQLKGSSN